MFNRRLLGALGVTTAVALGLAVWLNRPIAEQQSNDTQAFIPALKAQRDSVNALQIKTKQQTLTLQMQDNQWRVNERDGFVANNAKIRDLLTALGEAKIAETKTADPTRYAKLGVEDGGDKSLSLIVKAGEQVLADFIAGSSVYRPAGHYVRRVNEAPSYLIDRELQIGREVRDWIDADLIKLPATKIVKIERLLVPPAIQCIKAPCEAINFSLSKASGSAEFMLDNLPANKEMQAAPIVSGLSDVMNGLTANDVVKADKLNTQGAKQTVTRFYSDDKQIVTLTYSALNDKHYVAFALQAADDASAETKAALEKQAAKLQGWTFEINSYKGEGLARGIDELTQKKEAKK